MQCHHDKTCEVRMLSEKACQGRFCRDTCPHTNLGRGNEKENLYAELPDERERGHGPCDES